MQIKFYVAIIASNTKVSLVTMFNEKCQDCQMMMITDSETRLKNIIDEKGLLREIKESKTIKNVADGRSVGNEIFYPDYFFVKLFSKLLQKAISNKRGTHIEEKEFNELMSCIGYEKKNQIKMENILKYTFHIY